LHELEHSLSLRGWNPLGAVSRRDGEPITTDNNYRFDILYNMGDKKIENPGVGELLLLRSSGEGEKKRRTMIHNFVSNRPLLEKFFGRPIDSAYFDPNMLKAQVRFGTEGALFSEQIADLSALEQLTGKSLTRDKEMRKLFFPDDRSAEIYDAITGYRQTRLDSKDLPPYTPTPPEKKGIADWLKSRLGMKEGGEVTDDEFIQQMTVGTPPTDQGPRPYDQTAVAQFADYLRAPVDLAQTAVRGTVGAVVGPAYGVYKGLTGGKYGTPEGVREASEAGGELMQRITGEPKSQAAKDVLEFIGKKAEEYKLAPLPQLLTLPVPGPGALRYPAEAAKTQAEDIALRAVRSQTENPDISAAELYNAMLGRQAPGAAVVKPKGGNVILENIDIVQGKPIRSSPIANMRPTVTVPGEKNLPPSQIYASEAAARLKEQIERNKQAGYPTAYMEGQLSAIEPKAALDNWIQTKLGRYIRSDMGSEADPVRKLAEEMSTKVRSDYETGLKRIAKMKDDIAKAKAQGKNTDLSEEALAAEIDKVENAYRQTSMLPVSIGPYTHPSSTNVKARAMAGFPEEPISKSSLAKEWEEVADRQFYLHRAGDLVKADSPAFKANPWLANINPDEMVYMAPYVDEMHMFSHTLDELENALNPTSGLPQNLLLKPEDMQQLSIEKAFRLVNNINDWRLQQRTAANLEEAKRAAVTYKAYPDAPRKLQWQELKAPTYTELPPGYELVPSPSGTALFGPDGQRITDLDVNSPTPVKEQALQFLSKNDLERALKYEGSTMRHCVGGYCDPVWSGDTRIFSLRDNKGEPHVTIEVYPPRVEQSDAETMLAFLQANPRNVVQRLGFDADDFAYVYRSGSDYNPAALKEFSGFIKNVMAAPEYREWLSTLDRPAEIAQIKGKGNVKPTSSYIPFVQDFLTTQRWSRIGDLQNADVVALKPMMLKNAQEKGFNPQILFEMDGQSYITKEEFNRLADKFGGINKMAAGGEVTNFIRAHA
jgi:hypothetical protein